MALSTHDLVNAWLTAAGRLAVCAPKTNHNNDIGYSNYTNHLPPTPISGPSDGRVFDADARE
jgi:hypothetical protein